MPQIRPITDLRNTNEISEICNSKKEPVFITKNGYGDLVIMSIATYESILEFGTIDSAIAKVESEYLASNKLHDAKEALQSLKRKELPFEVKQSREELLGDRVAEMERQFQRAASETIKHDQSAGYPIALYDKVKKCPYLEYPDGRCEYADD